VTPSAERSVHQKFSRAEWARLRWNTALHLDEQDLAVLRGLNESIALDEVTEVYLPLTRLLNLHVAAARNLAIVNDAFFGRPASHVPYVIAVAGSVAAGKSTFARVLRAVLTRSPQQPHVELVTTDGFLWPNKVLKDRGLMNRKGFPESYDAESMIAFLAAIKGSEKHVHCPTYSHETYDIVPDARRSIHRPDVLVFEGLNVLQSAPGPAVACSEFFDFSVYLDAEESDLEKWFLARVFALQKTAFQQPGSFFYEYRNLSKEETQFWALDIWRNINLVNLRENIQPTRQRADLVLKKSSDHTISAVWLRRT